MSGRERLETLQLGGKPAEGTAATARPAPLALWRRVRVIHVLTALVAVLLVANLATQNREWHHLRKQIEALRGADAETGAKLDAIRKETHTLPPSAFAESSSGLESVPVDQGASQAELSFIARFRGPLLDLDGSDADLARPELPLRDRLLAGFARDGGSVSVGRTARQAMIVYALLRAHGSIATYAVRPAVPDGTRDLMLGASGNCADYTVRLMMLLEAAGVKASLISSVTPALPGHIFVDAYDPQDDAAYLLDSNFGVMIARSASGGRGFFDNLLGLSASDRRAFAIGAKIETFPVYFRFVDPGPAGLFGTPLTVADLNRLRPGRETLWRRWLADDLGDLVEWWRKQPNHRPRTLAEFREFAPGIPVEFQGSGDYASRLRTTAGF